MRLTKHHGLGNDFLVHADPSGLRPVSAELARAVCDRRTGVGADGLLRLGPGRHGAQLSMELRNADGTEAEMSGNGLACMVQAAVLAGLASGSEVAVATGAGPRSVAISATGRPNAHRMTVDMGPVAMGEEQPEWAGGQVLRAVRVDAGNPHLVLQLSDPEAPFDLVAAGEWINQVVPGGVNVEAVAVGDEPDVLVMRVYERGVGPTLACGTGACAAAAAFAHWKLTPQLVQVRQPGGTATVELGLSTFLTVPVVHVASVDFVVP